MSADAPRPRKPQTATAEAKRTSPRFEVKHEPLREGPKVVGGRRDLFEDIDDIRPRTARASVPAAAQPRRPEPLNRLTTPPDAYAPPRAPEPLRNSLPKRTSDLHYADHLLRELPGARMATPRGPVYEAPGGFLRGRPWLLAMVAAVSLLVVWFAATPAQTVISSFTGSTSSLSGDSLSAVFKNSQANVPAGEHSLLGAPSVSPQFIDKVLAHYGSPAQGTGAAWVEMGQRYGIDPAYALAFFIHESSAGTNPGWAGLKPDGSSTHNVGNIICAGYATCFGRFRDYPSWEVGIEDWYKLIANEYVADRGVATIEQVIPIYAPSFENDVDAYVGSVVTMADDWRQGVIR